MIYLDILLTCVYKCDKFIKNNKNNKKITWSSQGRGIDSEIYFKFFTENGVISFSNVSKPKATQKIITAHPLESPNV